MVIKVDIGQTVSNYFIFTFQFNLFIVVLLFQIFPCHYHLVMCLQHHQESQRWVSILVFLLLHPPLIFIMHVYMTCSSYCLQVQPGSPRKLELEEIAELMIEDQSPLCLKIEVSSEYKSSSCSPKSPKSSNLNAGPNYFVGLLQIEPNFTMMETPVLPKH